MIFSSTPETNDDPKPWIAATNGWEGRFATVDDARSAEDSPIADVVNMQSLGFVHDPRPEFDRAHKPNPILVEFRESIVEGNWPEGVRLAADYWLNALEFDPLDGTDDERWHAMRVLTRLARLA